MKRWMKEKKRTNSFFAQFFLFSPESKKMICQNDGKSAFHFNLYHQLTRTVQKDAVKILPKIWYYYYYTILLLLEKRKWRGEERGERRKVKEMMKKRWMKRNKMYSRRKKAKRRNWKKEEETLWNKDTNIYICKRRCLKCFLSDAVRSDPWSPCCDF